MKRPVIVLDQADLSIKTIYLDLKGKNPIAAEQFLTLLEATFDRLAEFPDSGRDVTHHDVPGLQLCNVKRYRNYLVLFRHDGERAEVLDVFHGAQDCGVNRV